MSRHEEAKRASPGAPIEYAQVRSKLRWGLVVLSGLLMVVAAAGWAAGVRGSPAKVLSAGLVVAFALAARFSSPLPALTVAALALTATAGTPGQAAGPLAAVAGLTLSASLVVLPTRQVVVPALALAGGTALRFSAFAWPPVAGAPSTVLGSIESGLFVAAIAFGGLAASRATQAAQSRQAEALEAERRAAAMKNEFVSMVSHELRTPLTNIGGFAMALREGWRAFDPAEMDEFLGVICGETEHLRRLVDDVLVVPRLEVDRLLIEPTDFPLRPAAFRIADLVFPPGGAKTASVSISGSAVVHADPNRVEQVLRNVLENAAKYGGSQVSVEASVQGAEWVVVVADDGPGVEAEHRERIFAPFEQANPSASPGNGLGLGLTVSRVLVEAMGGRIWYEPGFPTGARFCFTLPAAASPRPAPAPVAS